MAAVNQVIFNDETYIDLTKNNFTEFDLADGVTAHDKSGNLVVGAIPVRTANDVLVGNGYVTIPAGIYEVDTTKNTSQT